MKFKLKDLKKALDHLKYQCLCEDETEIEIRLSEEDIGNNKISSSMQLLTEYIKTPSSYDSCKANKQVVVTLELFPTDENRPMRSTIQETREIED